ncbi:hypothetical protein H9P43_009446 [Blastocladiella emersonii ATCC 22665]|nr:hypothetical protein H9P43_009446 [Blastocladiella emersonii ATCC 22665]
MSTDLTKRPTHPLRPFAARPADAVFFGYFASHIGFSLVMDFQAALDGLVTYPWPLRGLHSWYIKVSGDPLMGNPSAAHHRWFKAFLVCELLVQFPFFFLASRRIYDDRVGDRTRALLIAYGAHVATTMVPVLDALVTTDAVTPIQRAGLLGVYIPYLAVPAALVWHYGWKWASYTKKRAAYAARKADKAKW